jgi:hypothetical protein
VNVQPMNLGSCATCVYTVQRDRGPLPMNKGSPPIKAAVDRCRKIQSRFDRSKVEIYLTFYPRSQLSS